jgi:hypothetical protein
VTQDPIDPKSWQAYVAGALHALLSSRFQTVKSCIVNLWLEENDATGFGVELANGLRLAVRVGVEQAGNGHTVTIDEEQRQLVLLALAQLSLERPGWHHALGEVAKRFPGG